MQSYGTLSYQNSSYLELADIIITLFNLTRAHLATSAYWVLYLLFTNTNFWLPINSVNQFHYKYKFIGYIKKCRSKSDLDLHCFPKRGTLKNLWESTYKVEDGKSGARSQQIIYLKRQIFLMNKPR